MKKLLFAMLAIGLSNLALGQSYISKVYCTALGNDEIKQEYKEIIIKALKECDVVHPEQVAIKKMNSVGQVIALMPLASFTAFGIWFDEQYLDSCSQEERTFQIYHEAAHYAQQHHQKVLISSAAISSAAIAGLISFNSSLQKNNSPHSLAMTVAVSTIAAATVYIGMLPYIVKHQEKEADLQACRKLVALDRTDIIKDRIRNLRRSGSSCGNIWWFSEIEQAEYLQKAIE
jgi:peptidase M48-like protein